VRMRMVGEPAQKRRKSWKILYLKALIVLQTAAVCPGPAAALTGPQCLQQWLLVVLGTPMVRPSDANTAASLAAPNTPPCQDLRIKKTGVLTWVHAQESAVRMRMVGEPAKQRALQTQSAAVCPGPAAALPVLGTLLVSG
jgi:hypothetical protein